MFKCRTRRKFKHFGPLLSVVTLCTALLGASEAQAVTCAEYLAPFVTWANGYNHVEATIVSNQAYLAQYGSIASASVGGQKVKMRMLGDYYLSTEVDDWRVARGRWTFSDRAVGGAAWDPGAQPFAASAYESIGVYIAKDGTAAHIYVASWDAWIYISPLTCDRGLMYGFGNAIVSGPGALYVFSLEQAYDIN